jgi:hypothetical protein
MSLRGEIHEKERPTQPRNLLKETKNHTAINPPMQADQISQPVKPPTRLTPCTDYTAIEQQPTPRRLSGVAI